MDREVVNSVAFVANPFCGNGNLRDAINYIQSIQSSFTKEIYVSRSHEDTKRIIDDAIKRRYRAVCVMGGDGTLNKVLPQTLNCKIPVGVIPFGTANDLAYALGVNRLNINSILKENRIRSIDVIKVNGIPYTSTAGVGAPAETCEYLAKIRYSSKLFKFVHRLLKSKIYSLLVGTVLFFNKSVFKKVRIKTTDIDEVVTTGCLLVTNMKKLGRDFIIAPDAELDDGKFDVLIIRADSRLGLLKQVLRAKKGIFDEKTLRFSTDHMIVESVDGSKLRYFGDGDTLGNDSKLEFKIDKKSLNVLHLNPP